MRKVTKWSAIIATSLAVAGLTGCATNTEDMDTLKSRLSQAERTANDALAAANRAQSTADAAQNTANSANQSAQEAVESVTRMAESCCRK